jgi:hypothetical protein
MYKLFVISWADLENFFGVRFVHHVNFMRYGLKVTPF